MRVCGADPSASGSAAGAELCSAGQPGAAVPTWTEVAPSVLKRAEPALSLSKAVPAPHMPMLRGQIKGAILGGKWGNNQRPNSGVQEIQLWLGETESEG